MRSCLNLDMNVKVHKPTSCVNLTILGLHVQ